MPRVRLILEDDQGNQSEQTYALEGQCDTLNQIETAVERFKHQALPHMERALLTQAQERFAAQAQERFAAQAQERFAAQEKKTHQAPPAP
jgi:hypothetical protein